MGSDMVSYQKIAFLFPGQGAQYVGMGKDFLQHSLVHQTFEEADDHLSRNLSRIIFEGPATELTETRNSQLAIFVFSTALLRLIRQLFPEISPSVCAGLSLGEYTALHASQRLSFTEVLDLVRWRSQYMNDACEREQGTMAVVLGLEGNVVEETVASVSQTFPNQLWAANFNCPGQVVISGTAQGIQVGTTALQAKGAKRILPLQVHGAFHSGLMMRAEQALTPHIAQLTLQESPIELVMNATGNRVKESEQIRTQLIKQVCSPVRWEQGIRYMEQSGVDCYIEMGCGKTLAGFNKRIGTAAPTWSIEHVEDLTLLESILK
jgi:[acyl-carrier-protein] S-malonyltransferase